MKQAEYSKRIFRILSLIRIIVNNVRLYSLNHAQVETQVGQLFKEFITAFSVRPAITLMLIENDLVINNKAVSEVVQKNFTLFIKILQEKEVGFVTFQKGIKKNELRLFIEHLAAPGEETVQPFSSPCIQMGKVGLKEKTRKGVGKGSRSGQDDLAAGPGLPAGHGNDLHRAEEINRALATLNSMATDRLDIIKEYYDKMKRFRQCDTRNVEGIITVFLQCFSKNMNPLAMLSVMKEADEYTFTHMVNVCILTLAQAAGLGFSGDTLQKIGIAASLHDVGKIFTPDEILNKPEKLNPAEMKEIEMHPAKGASYILNLKNLPRLAVLAALEHHMRYDGNGYPNAGERWRPHIISQMVAIADTFDAMRSHRPYQEAKADKIIFGVLKDGKGTLFNPMLVDNFIRVVVSRPQFN